MSLLAVAEEAAIAAGGLLRERFEAGAERALRAKSTPTDFVSEADLAAEAAIREVLAARRPDDAVLGGGGRPAWAPSDAPALGRRPARRHAELPARLPAWCVSVAVRDAEGPLAGVILDPLRGELFAASRDGEARLGEAVLGGSACPELAQAIVGTGFAYEAQVRAGQGEVGRAAAAEDREPPPHRRCALDLAWTAAGRLDAFYERAVQEWDVAAGELICARAGLVVERMAAVDGMPAGILRRAAGVRGRPAVYRGSRLTTAPGSSLTTRASARIERGT